MSHILCEIDDTPGARTARVMLHHAGKFNSMSRSMWRQLRDVFLDRKREPRQPIRCVAWSCTALTATSAPVATFP